MPAQLGHVALARAEQRRAVVSNLCVCRAVRASGVRAAPAAGHDPQETRCRHTWGMLCMAEQGSASTGEELVCSAVCIACAQRQQPTLRRQRHTDSAHDNQCTRSHNTGH
jgi:hypothetical protein